MGFSKGTKRDSEISITRYIGIAAVKILALNPNAEQQNKLFNTQAFTEDPVYTGKGKAKNSKGEDIEAPQIRLNFVVATNPKIACNNGIEMTSNISFFITKAYQYSHKNGIDKIKVIDEFGRTAWATSEELKNKAVPVYANGPARISNNYRPCYIGEEEVINFLKTYLGIPNPEVWNAQTEKFVQRPAAELEDCKASLTNIEKYFSGDVSEIKEILTYQPENMIKVLFGVRTADDGKQYQTVFTRKFLSVASTNLNGIKNELANAQQVGAYSTTAFEVCDLKEFNIQATDYSKDTDADDFNQTPNDDLPFGGVE